MQALNVKHDLGESLPTEFVLERNEYKNGYQHTASVSKNFFIPSWWPIARCAHFGTPHPDKIDLPWSPEERMSKKDFIHWIHVSIANEGPFGYDPEMQLNKAIKERSPLTSQSMEWVAHSPEVIRKSKTLPYDVVIDE